MGCTLNQRRGSLKVALTRNERQMSNNERYVDSENCEIHISSSFHAQEIEKKISSSPRGQNSIAQLP